MANERQIKSKKRVADHGEVFTAEREVNAMLDLAARLQAQTQSVPDLFSDLGDEAYLPPAPVKEYPPHITSNSIFKPKPKLGSAPIWVAEVSMRHFSV